MKQSRPWLILCAAILLLGVAGCLWVLRPTGGDTVEILQDGKMLYTFDLSQSENQIIEIPYGGSSNTIQVQDGKIRVLEAECPDQACVHMGYLSDTGLPIVCLPNRLVIQYTQTKADGATAERGERMRTKRLTELALLATIALTIFMVESKIPNPIPLPGVKLGLANIVTVYAVYRFRPKEVILLLTTRIILGAVFGGNMMALLYSAAGGALCLLGMLPLHRLIPEKALWISSILGAVFHNVGQITAALLVTQSLGVIMYFPFLLVSGCCAGCFTGLCAQFLLQRKLHMMNAPQPQTEQ